MQGKKSFNSWLLILCQILPLFWKEYKAFWMENLKVYHQLLGPFFLASFNPSPFRNSYFPFCTNIIQIWWVISTILGSLTSKGFFEWCMSTEADFFTILGHDCAQIFQQIVSVRVRHLNKQIFSWKACWKGKKASLWVDVPPFSAFKRNFKWYPMAKLYLPLSRLLISCLTLSALLQTVSHTFS